MALFSNLVCMAFHCSRYIRSRSLYWSFSYHPSLIASQNFVLPYRNAESFSSSLSPAKPLLTKAMVHAWNHRIDESLALLTQVLHTEAATPEDRFHAYAALVAWHAISVGGQQQSQWGEAEVNPMPATHGYSGFQPGGSLSDPKRLSKQQ